MKLHSTDSDFCGSSGTSSAPSHVWKPSVNVTTAQLLRLQESRMVTDHRDHRIPCTCIQYSCPEISPVAYVNVLRHTEFGGSSWFRIKDPEYTEGLRRKYPRFTNEVYNFKAMIQDWEYFSHIPKTGEPAFIKLLQKTMYDDRRLIISSKLAGQI